MVLLLKIVVMDFIPAVEKHTVAYLKRAGLFAPKSLYFRGVGVRRVGIGLRLVVYAVTGEASGYKLRLPPVRKRGGIFLQGQGFGRPRNNSIGRFVGI